MTTQTTLQQKVSHVLFKGRVNPATIFKPEFYTLFTILNMNMYSIITNINNSL